MSDGGDGAAARTVRCGPRAASSCAPGAGGPEVLLVHRPRYDDWSFPKGKRDGDETDEETALREVAEETGLVCVLGRQLGEARYRDQQGPAQGRALLADGSRPDGLRARRSTPDDEVDELRWCSPRRGCQHFSPTRTTVRC